MGYVNAKAPKEVYHLTPKKNLPSILNEKAIKRFSDKECWFCESLPKLKKYMEYTVLQEGKLYYGVGGIPSHYPKFVPEDYVVLKLTPEGRNDRWVRWMQEVPEDVDQTFRDKANEFSNLKIGYRGNFRFAKYELLGRAMCWAGENESGSELYNTFSEFFGMTDEEIRDMGFTSLVPYFDRDRYAETIANYLIDEGTRDTVSGNLHIPFSEINERFAVSLPSDVELLEKINDNLMRSEIVSDLDTDEDFDLMFFTVFCPNHEERFAEESENVPTLTM